MQIVLYIFSLTAYVSAVSVSLLVDDVRDQLLSGSINLHIVGGEDMTILKYPYQASIRRIYETPQDPFEHWCGASIYSSNVVITAAHCLMGTIASDWEVRAGSSNREGNDGYTVHVKEIIVHENFQVENDNGLLILDSPLPINNVTTNTIQLAQHGPHDGQIGIVAGWGLLKNGESPDILQVIEVPIISNNACSEDYEANISETMVCADYRGIGGKDSCNGDSGGPLVVDGKLAGIVSWGDDDCGSPKSPGVYTRVSALYSWVIKKLSEINGQLNHQSSPEK